MAQRTDAQLTTEKDVIKDETTANANSATRIGEMLENIIDSKVNNDDFTEHFKGVFASEAALELAFPTAEEGDYALVDVGAAEAQLFIWDDTDTDWIASGVTTIVPDASETVKGISERATQAEANEGTNDAAHITPLKAHVKNRKSAAPTGNTTIDQEDHDQAVIFSNSASAINYVFPVLAAGTYLTIIQVNDGDITWTNSGGTTFEGPAAAINGGDVGTAVTFYYRTTTEIVVISGDVAQLSGLSVNGALAVKAGASSGVIAKVGGVIHQDTTQTGNVGTGEDTLFTYVLPGSALNANGDSIRGYVVGTYAATANNKNIRVKFGATTIFATGAIAANVGDWRIDFDIIRTGATTQKCIARYTSSNTTLDETCDYTTAAETLAGLVTILVTGEATANNDIVGEIFKISFEPHE
jgi:hypothetical protein